MYVVEISRELLLRLKKYLLERIRSFEDLWAVDVLRELNEETADEEEEDSNSST